LLHLLNRRLHVTPDGYGLKPNLSSYLRQFTPPKFELGVGAVDQLVRQQSSDEGNEQSEDKPKLEPARDHAQNKTASKPAKQPLREAAAAAAGTAAAADAMEAGAAPQQPESGSGVFDKPSPFVSAPKPAAEQAQAAPEAEASRPPAPALGSAPIPSKQDGEGQQPPAAPLGSAPIPAAEPAASPQADKVIPPKPPVDIELTGENELPDSIGAAEEPDYDATVVIAPDASLSRKPDSANSTDAFIARVKQQLSNPEPLDENDESFTSTIPQ
jgi:hypothetical protein